MKMHNARAVELLTLTKKFCNMHNAYNYTLREIANSANPALIEQKAADIDYIKRKLQELRACRLAIKQCIADVLLETTAEQEIPTT